MKEGHVQITMREEKWNLIVQALAAIWSKNHIQSTFRDEVGRLYTDLERPDGAISVLSHDDVDSLSKENPSPNITIPTKYWSTFFGMALDCIHCGRRFRPSLGLLIHNVESMFTPLDPKLKGTLEFGNDVKTTLRKIAANTETCMSCFTNTEQPGEIIDDDRVISMNVLEEILARETSVVNPDDVCRIMKVIRRKITPTPEAKPPPPQDIPF